MKIALVTGGSRGLGKSMALHLARKGYGVVLTYKTSREKAEEVAEQIAGQGGRAAALELDVADSASFPSFVASLATTIETHWPGKQLELLVNNAGIGMLAPFPSVTEEAFDELMKIHLKAPFFLTQRLLPLMADGGKIINVSSGLARFAFPGYSAYAIMKGGVEILSRYLALELGERKITVNTIAPGAIETDFGGGAVRDDREVNQFIASQTALGRVGLPDDVGAAVAALATEECGWINGQRIEISGGMRL